MHSMKSFPLYPHETPICTDEIRNDNGRKIATVTGDSKWITGEAARRQVHEDRNRCAAIMAGVGTVIADNPMLNCRLPEGHSPVRIICDTSLRTPADSLVVTTAKEIPTILATCCTDKEKQKVFTDKGCKILEVSEMYDKTAKAAGFTGFMQTAR